MFCVDLKGKPWDSWIFDSLIELIVYRNGQIWSIGRDRDLTGILSRAFRVRFPEFKFSEPDNLPQKF